MYSTYQQITASDNVFFFNITLLIIRREYGLMVYCGIYKQYSYLEFYSVSTIF